MKNIKAIIDTDPGVDDTTALVLSFFQKDIDIKLITTVSGNIGVHTATRNACFLLDLFGQRMPVSKGADRATARASKDAKWLHGKHGMGGFVPPLTTYTQPTKQPAVEMMHRVIIQNPNEIVIFVLGPHTNVATLLKKYPECASLIKQIVFMGGSQFDQPDFPNHISFNIKTDPEAFETILESGINLLMVPSNIGRSKAGLFEEDVKQLGNYGEVGKFLQKTYEGYIEPNLIKHGLKVVATNDTCAIFSKLYPQLFTIKKANITVDLQNDAGKTYINYCDDGAVDVVVDVNREKFIKLFFDSVKELAYIPLNLNLKG